MNFKCLLLLLLYFSIVGNTYASKGGTIEISINEEGFSLENKGTTFFRGQTLRFINTGAKSHRIQDRASFIDSGNLNPGQYFDFTIPSSVTPPSDPYGLTFYDNLQFEVDTNTSFTIGKALDPVLLFPRDSWILSSNDFKILVLLGSEWPSLLPVLNPDLIIGNINLKLNNKIVFNGTLGEFKNLAYVQGLNGIKSPFGQGTSTGSRGYLAYHITIPAGYLEPGAHTITLTLTMGDESTHVEEGKYIVVE